MESKSGLHAKENCCAVAIYTVHACESVSLSYSAVGYSFHSFGDIFRDSFFSPRNRFSVIGNASCDLPKFLILCFFPDKMEMNLFFSGLDDTKLLNYFTNDVFYCLVLARPLNPNSTFKIIMLAIVFVNIQHVCLTLCISLF